ncbi:plasmid mobilization protein [Clostridium sp.]|uniref:plasmid mobilization protein n=1 Tax=Clostridium sp. TaxID=1506 RepID=UPI0039940F96
MLKELWDRLFEDDEEEEFEDYEENQGIIKKKHYSNGIRDQRIQIRVTKSEKEMIEKLAKIQYMNSSNFIRWLIFKKYINDFIKE